MPLTRFVSWTCDPANCTLLSRCGALHVPLGRLMTPQRSVKVLSQTLARSHCPLWQWMLFLAADCPRTVSIQHPPR